VKANNEFWEQVEKTDYCWNWTGKVNDSGHGWFYLNKQTWYAHRVSVVHFGRRIPYGFDVDHLCRNTRCVNPTHLDPVDKHEHGRRSGPYGYLRQIQSIVERLNRLGMPSSEYDATLQKATAQVRDMDLFRFSRIKELSESDWLDDALDKIA
jgi:hypothetical protein